MVVTHQRWVLDEMRSGSTGPVTGSYGLDVPDAAPGSAWWMPPGFAARLTLAGACPPLTAPGPSWLPTLSRTHPNLTGRAVHALTVADLPGLPGPGWVKPAQAKVEGFPARWRTPAQAVTDAHAAGLPDDAALHYSPTDLGFDIEVRCHVLHGTVVSASTYRLARMDYPALLDRPVSLMYARDETTLLRAVRFAQQVVDALDGRYPAGWVLDVGSSRHLARWAVVEANAAWASAWYDAPLPRVRDVIDAACPDITRPAGAREHTEWGWAPDPVETNRAQRQAKLTPTPATLAG